MIDGTITLREAYEHLYGCYGPQHWWPGETPFEVMVGAVLTQNTAWSNVEKAIANLRHHEALSPEAIVTAPPAELAQWLRPSGYFNIKAQRLQSFCRWYLEAGGLERLAQRNTAELRQALLSVKGIGPETADDVLLYAFGRPVFVIDAYTRRLVARLGLADGDEDYEALRSLFEHALGGAQEANVPLFNEYHALVVVHAKTACRKRPSCSGCVLAARCTVGMRTPDLSTC